MVRLYCATLVPLVAAAAVGAKTSLYLSPAQELTEPITINAQEANQILSHHLDIFRDSLDAGRTSIWDHLLKNTDDGVELDPKVNVERLFDGHQDDQNRLLVLMHGAGDEDVVPSSLRATHSIESSPSPSSFDALVENYMSTLSQTLQLSETAFSHLSANFLQGLTSGLNWLMGSSRRVAGAWADQLSRFSSAAFDQLRDELSAVDGLIARLQRQDLSSSDVDLSFQPLRFSGLEEVKSTYGSKSEEFDEAKRVVASALEQLYALFQNRSKSQGRSASVAFIVTDNNEASLTKRSASSDILEPFFGVERDSPLNGGAAIRPAKSSSPKPVVNLVGTCFSSQSDLEKASNGCSGHGKAKQSSRGGKKCWRCQCSPTTEKGKKTYWAGAACEKKDVSTEFFLLGSSAILLVLITAGSVYFLFDQGSAELPGTLASVTINLK